MEIWRLGRTDLEISVLSIGGPYTSSLAGGVAETHHIMHEAIERGIMVPHHPWEEPMVLPAGKNYVGPGIASLGAAVQVGKLDLEAD